MLLPVSHQTVGERGQRLVVVNLQRTPLDHLCALRIYAKTDQVHSTHYIDGGWLIVQLSGWLCR